MSTSKSFISVDVSSSTRKLQVATVLLACPLCQPELWDADLEVTPAVVFCLAHFGHPVREFFTSVEVLRSHDAIFNAEVAHV